MRNGSCNEKNLRRLSDEERLKEAKLFTLEKRQIFENWKKKAYKIMNGTETDLGASVLAKIKSVKLQG